MKDWNEYCDEVRKIAYAKRDSFKGKPLMSKRLQIAPSGSYTIYNDRSQMHAETEPAVVLASGIIEFRREGRLDNPHGPAVIYPDGTYKFVRWNSEITAEQWMRHYALPALESQAVEVHVDYAIRNL